MTSPRFWSSIGRYIYELRGHSLQFRRRSRLRKQVVRDDKQPDERDGDLGMHGHCGVFVPAVVAVEVHQHVHVEREEVLGEMSNGQWRMGRRGIVGKV